MCSSDLQLQAYVANASDAHLLAIINGDVRIESSNNEEHLISKALSEDGMFFVKSIDISSSCLQQSADSADSNANMSPAIKRATSKGGRRRRHFPTEETPGMTGPYRWSAVVAAKMHRNMVYEAEEAARLFVRQEYPACVKMCINILHSEPSEAIAARAHMHMYSVPMEPGCLDLKLHHIKQALIMWTTVIKRTGASRFPIDLAQAERQKVKRALAAYRIELLVATGKEHLGSLLD